MQGAGHEQMPWTYTQGARIYQGAADPADEEGDSLLCKALSPLGWDSDHDLDHGIKISDLMCICAWQPVSCDFEDFSPQAPHVVESLGH